MLEIKLRKELACPVIVCDHCGEEIIDALNANAIWQENLDKDQTPGNVFFVHKECDLLFQRKRSDPSKTWCWNGLDVWLLYLTNNVSWDAKKAKQTADRLAGLQP
ncbi:MAG: hypothetical protein WCV00_11100 [Verrucomicrobiia bacterium]|jgi:hypothetical protein